MAAPVATGFFGKIPARGDFVRAGLPRGFVMPWDDWLQRMLAGSRGLLGRRWLPAWMEAPIWRFALPAGHCGDVPVLGVWLPSIDAAGRHFPLTLARVGPLPARHDPWLDAAEAIGLDALQHDLSPEEVAERLGAADVGPPAADPDPALARWWTAGSPFVPPICLVLPALPDDATFAAMLHAAPVAVTEDQPAGPSGTGGVPE